MKPIILAASAAIALAAAASPAAARSIPSGGLTVEEVKTWLQDGGYKAEIRTSEDGDRFVRSGAEGVTFDINMYDCSGARCASMQFNAGFDLTNGSTAGSMNDWNAGKRYTRAWIDDENDPWLAYDANLSPGGTYEAIDDDLAVWIMQLADFKKHINW